MTIRAKRKIFLTGTPVQNNLVELISLINFLMPQALHGINERIIKKLFQITTKNTNKEDPFYVNKVDKARSNFHPINFLK